jgi:Secretion system C-terminal sorting domain
MKIITVILFSLFLFAPQSERVWTMYPNPARDHVTIDIKDGELAKYIKIYDMNGRLVQEESIDGRALIQMNLHLRPGSYVVFLEDKK